MKEASEEQKREFVRLFQERHGDCNTVTRQQILELVKDGAPDPAWLWVNGEFKVGNGVYKIPSELLPKKTVKPNLQGIRDLQTGFSNYDTDKIPFDLSIPAMIPDEDPLYVPFGNYYDVETITKSGKFFPYWIYGLSGNGKTLSIEQAHARIKKPLIMVPITREADEDALLGGLRLWKGDTIPFFGPITLGALMGCTVCLDETDLGDEKLMALQTALQNRPFPIKRLGKVIYPQPGFNLCATANTKGQGSDTGKFIGTNVMNEAMLDRYVNFFDQRYPEPKTERQILTRVLTSLGHTNQGTFIERLIQWAEKIRETFDVGGTTEVITTRRLVHICRSYDMYGKDRKKAIECCISRFQQDVQKSFMDFYKLIDDSWNKKEEDDVRVAEALKNGIDPETDF